MTKAYRALATVSSPSTRSANESGGAARSSASAKAGLISLSVLPVERHRSPLAAIVQGSAAVPPTPDDHLRAGPDRSVGSTSRRRARRRRRCPGVRDRIVMATIVQVAARARPAPDDHPGTGPHRCVVVAPRRRARCRHRRPGVRDRVVLAAVVQATTALHRLAAPDDHLGTGPHRCVDVAWRRRAHYRRRRPGVRDRVVLAAIVKGSVAAAEPAPDDHPRAGPDRRVAVAYRRRARRRRRRRYAT